MCSRPTNAAVLGILTVLLVTTSACSQNVPPENNIDTVGAGEQRTTREIVIAETLAENPELAPFVDASGAFDVIAAEDYLIDEEGMDSEPAFDHARDMEQEWNRAMIEKSREVVTRV